ncbi:MAG: hypothetical protein ACRDJP_08685 [Actinomycetota bacterium]
MSRPLPRWITIGLPVVVLTAAGLAGVAALLEGGEPEPVGTDTAPVPTETTGRDGVLSFEVRSADCGFENVIAEERIPADGQFCLATVGVGAAVSGTTERLDLGCQYLITRERERYVADEEATLAGVDPRPFRDGIRPGTATEVEVTYDIPTDAAAVAVELHSSCDSEGARLALVFEGASR